MPKRTSDYRSWMLKQLTDPRVSANYINTTLNDSPEAFLRALRNVAEARRMSKVAEEAGVSRESLYRTLSEEGNPRFDTLRSVLRVLGLRIAVEVEATFSSAGETSPSKLFTAEQMFGETRLDLGETKKPVGAKGLISSGSQVYSESQGTPAHASL